MRLYQKSDSIKINLQFDTLHNLPPDPDIYRDPLKEGL